MIPLGICLDYDTCKRLSFDRFKETVKEYLCCDDRQTEECIRFRYNQIRPTRTGQIFTTQMTKKWKAGITKANVQSPQGKVLPFGHFNTKDIRTLRSCLEFWAKNPEYMSKYNEPSFFFMEDDLKEREEKERENMLRSMDPDGLLPKEREMRDREIAAQEWGDRIEMSIFGKIISR